MTIKTQGGKVITKEGKVSCECCDDCCMYPADRLFPFSANSAFFTFDNLPDALEADLGSGIVVFNKEIKNISGRAWKLYQSEEDEEGQIIWNLDESQYGTLGCSLGEPENGPTYRSNFSGPQCCLFDNDSPFKDQFADTYTISGPISGTVTRESICAWRGEGLRLTNFGFQWKVNGNNKSGLQNTPVGSYAGGFTVS